MYQPGSRLRQTNHPSRIHEHLLLRCQPSVIMLTPENSEHLQHSLRGCTMASSPFCSQASGAATLWRGRPRDRVDLLHLAFWVVRGRKRRSTLVDKSKVAKRPVLAMAASDIPQ